MSQQARARHVRVGYWMGVRVGENEEMDVTDDWGSGVQNCTNEWTCSPPNTNPFLPYGGTTGMLTHTHERGIKKEIKLLDPQGGAGALLRPGTRDDLPRKDNSTIVKKQPKLSVILI